MWQEVRATRPALFKGIISAAAVISGMKDHNLTEALFHETERYIIEQAVLLGHKSFDLLQGLLLLSVWHRPPKGFQNLKYFQYGGIAATILMDLRFSGDSRFKIPSAKEVDEVEITDQLLEVCRTFTACYYLSSR